MTNPWLAALFALFLWWFSTGIILWRVRVADNGGKRQHLVSVLVGLPLLAGGAWLATHGANDTTVLGVYLGFIAALALWGWIELAFLSGVITGPVTTPCPAGLPVLRRFWRAVGTIAWHEAALVATLLALAMIPNGSLMAFLTFAVLFAARVSAKLNLFFGVPRINTQFLPRPLAHLPSHFRMAPASAFFPVSVLLLAVLTAFLLQRTIAPGTPEFTVGFALLTCLSALALLEHFFMILPLPDERLWRWMLPDATPGAKPPSQARK